MPFSRPSIVPETRRSSIGLGHYASCKWSPELIESLDWKRVAEISRAMASNAGYQLSGTRIDMEAGCEFTMSRGRWRKKERTLVRLASWNHWTATMDCVKRFAEYLQGRRGTQGILIAPGGFAPWTEDSAHRSKIETVDAAKLATRLNSLPAEHSDFFFDVGTAGDASTPSCPVCLQPLKAYLHTPDLIDRHSRHDLSYRQSDIIAEPIAARRIEVLPNCEVRFLREVYARDLVVNGVVNGDFVCEGTVLLNPGAVLHGSVAARSVTVRSGAELRGDTRILEGSLKPRYEPKAISTWKCTNSKRKDRCGEVCLLPH